jgi:hypothetical protein
LGIKGCLAVAGRFRLRKYRVEAKEGVFGVEEFKTRKLFRLEGSCV